MPRFILKASSGSEDEFRKLLDSLHGVSTLEGHITDRGEFIINDTRFFYRHTRKDAGGIENDYLISFNQIMLLIQHDYFLNIYEREPDFPYEEDEYIRSVNNVLNKINFCAPENKEEILAKLTSVNYKRFFQGCISTKSPFSFVKCPGDNFVRKIFLGKEILISYIITGKNPLIDEEDITFEMKVCNFDDVTKNLIVIKQKGRVDTIKLEEFRKLIPGLEIVYSLDDDGKENLEIVICEPINLYYNSSLINLNINKYREEFNKNIKTKISEIDAIINQVLICFTPKDVKKKSDNEGKILVQAKIENVELLDEFLEHYSEDYSQENKILSLQKECKGDDVVLKCVFNISHFLTTQLELAIKLLGQVQDLHQKKEAEAKAKSDAIAAELLADEMVEIGKKKKVKADAKSKKPPRGGNDKGSGKNKKKSGGGKGKNKTKNTDRSFKTAPRGGNKASVASTVEKKTRSELKLEKYISDEKESILQSLGFKKDEAQIILDPKEDIIRITINEDLEKTHKFAEFQGYVESFAQSNPSYKKCDLAVEGQTLEIKYNRRAGQQRGDACAEILKFVSKTFRDYQNMKESQEVKDKLEVEDVELMFDEPEIPAEYSAGGGGGGGGGGGHDHEEFILEEFNARVLESIKARKEYNNSIAAAEIESLTTIFPNHLRNLISHLADNSEEVKQVAMCGSFIFSQNPDDLDFMVVMPDDIFDSKGSDGIRSLLPENLRCCADVKISSHPITNDKGPSTVHKVTIGDKVEITVIKESDHILNNNWVSKKDSQIYDFKERRLVEKPSYKNACDRTDKKNIINEKVNRWPFYFVYQNLPDEVDEEILTKCANYFIRKAQLFTERKGEHADPITSFNLDHDFFLTKKTWLRKPDQDDPDLEIKIRHAEIFDQQVKRIAKKIQELTQTPGQSLLSAEAAVFFPGLGTVQRK